MDSNGKVNRHVEKVIAPDLKFNSDESDSENDVPAVIFHPALKSKDVGNLFDDKADFDNHVDAEVENISRINDTEEQRNYLYSKDDLDDDDNVHIEGRHDISDIELKINGDASDFILQKDSGVELIVENGENASQFNNNVLSIDKPIINGEDILPTLSISESSLDHVLQYLPKIKKSCEVNDTCSVSCDSSNSSDLMSQLGMMSTKLKDEKDRDKAQVNKSVDKSDSHSPIKHIGVGTEKESKSTSANFQVPANLSVIQRYGSYSIINDDNENECTAEDIRQKIKEDSFQICKNKGVLRDQTVEKTSRESSNESNSFCSDRLVQHTDDKLSFIQLSNKKEQEKPTNNKTINKTVDDMLQNVNRLINGESVENYSDIQAKEEDFYDDTTDIITDEEEEYVQSYTIFHDGSSEEIIENIIDDKYITPNLYVSSLQENEEREPDLDEVVLYHEEDIDKKSKVIEWNEILKEEHYDINGVAISPLKTPKKNNIFDNMFANSFIVDDKKSKKEYKKTDTTPKKDILGTKKKQKCDENKSNNRSFYSESCNKKYVEGLYTDKANQNNDNDSLFKEVDKFKIEIENCLKEEEMKNTTNALAKLTRQLNFSNDYINANGNVIVNRTVGEPICLACTLPNMLMETPLKHIDGCPIKASCPVKETKKTQSIGVSTTFIPSKTDDMLNDAVKPKSKNKKKKKKNKKANNGQCEESPTDTPDEVSNPIVTESTVASTSTIPDKMTTEIIEKQNIETRRQIIEKEILDANRKGAAIKEFIQSIQTDGFEILLDETSSFSKPIENIPLVNKELLMLKIPLEAPGVCKSSSNESKLAYSDERNSDNFIELVTLFTLLLKGSKWDLPTHIPNIPFDVVSMQQCMLDEELILLVGIAENNNAQQYKVKRTKLGSTFFHAVSSFFNNTQLSDILKRIWEHAGQNTTQHPSLSGEIFQQIQHNDKLKANFSTRKLSSFINVIPDNTMLHKVLNIPAAIKPHVYRKNNNANSTSFDSLNWFETSLVIPEYTCINIENIVLMQPKYIIEFFKRLRYESVDICGLRVGYPSKDANSLPILTVAICEVDAANVEEGKILLSECEYLLNVPISFQSDNQLSVSDEAIIKYSLNKQRSHRNLVQWFGPNFKSVEDFQDYSQYNKLSVSSTLKNQQKRKAIVDTPNEGMPLLVSAPCYGILLVSSALPSALLSLIISLAGKRGLSLKAFVRNAFSSNQLNGYGIPDFHINELRRQQTMSPSNNTLCFNVLLFNGCNAVLRLNGITNKFTSIINTSVTGETLNRWTNDKYFHIGEKSHNLNMGSHVKKRSTSQDYFAVLILNESTHDIFKSTKDSFSSKYFNIFKHISDNGIAKKTPSLNLALYALYGHLTVKLIPDLLRKLNSKYVLSCLNTTHKIFTNKNYLHESPLELIGLKYINKPKLSQIQSILPKKDEKNETLSNEIMQSNIVLLVFKANNHKTLEVLNDVIREFLTVSVEREPENVIIHSDQDYVLQLIFQFFQPYEIFVDNKPSRHHLPSVYLSDQNQIFQILEKIYNMNLSSKCVKKDISKNENFTTAIKSYQLQPPSYIYDVPMFDLPYLIQLLFTNMKSYAGYSVRYTPEHAGVIVKVLSRFRRMGFKICALKFPSYDKDTSCNHLRIGLVRENALVVLHKLMLELESSYKMLQYSVTETINEVKTFFTNEMKDRSGGGGLFHCNYWAAYEKLQFEKDDAFEGRHSRTIEWNPQSPCFTYEYDEEKQQSVAVSSSILSSSTIKTHEVTVVLITDPLISGKYLGKEIPFEANFLEFWTLMEKVGYRAIGMKMTSLSENDDIKELLQQFDMETKRRKQLDFLMSSVEVPFIAAAFLGSCILSNIWIQLERNIKCPEALEVLKKFTLVSKSRKEADYLLTSLFNQVFTNRRIAIQTKMS